MPDEPEALGLLALMLLHDARRAARVDGAGDLVPLEEQDRSLLGPPGDRGGHRAAGRGPAPAASRALPGAGRHRRLPRQAADAKDTDWAEIAALYGRLADMRPVARRRAQPGRRRRHGLGPEEGLALVDRLQASGELPALPPPAGRPGRHAAPSRAPRRGRRGIPGGPRPGGHRRRAPISRAPSAGGVGLTPV